MNRQIVGPKPRLPASEVMKNCPEIWPVDGRSDNQVKGIKSKLGISTKKPKISVNMVSSNQTVGEQPTLFDRNGEMTNFEEWLEQFENWMIANTLDEGEDRRKQALFRVALGTEGQRRMKKITAKDYDELLQKAADEFKPRDELVILRLKFLKRRQRRGERTRDFIAELRKLAAVCQLGEETEGVILTVLLMNMFNQTWAQDLAIKVPESLEEAERRIEQWEKDFEVKTQMKRMTENNDVRNKPMDRTGEIPTCGKCGGRHYITQECRAKDVICHNCKRMGHYARMCKAPIQTKKSTNEITEELEELEIADSTNEVKKIGRKDGKEYVDLMINETKVTLLIDCGSNITVLNEEAVGQMGLGDKVVEAKSEFEVFGGGIIQSVGILWIEMRNGSRKVNVKSTVVRRGTNLLSAKDAKMLGLVTFPKQKGISKNNIIYGHYFNNTKAVYVAHKEVKPAANYSPVGSCKFSYRIELREGCKPVCMPGRPVPYALRDETIEAIKKLVREGILTEAEQTDWVSPIVVTKKGRTPPGMWRF